jgi:molecular chaperone HscB
VDVEDESSKLAADPRHLNEGVSAGGGDMELLMQVMEAREAIDEAREEEDLVELRNENEERIARSEEVLEHAFMDGDLSRAAREAVRLRYWVNIRDSLHGWEKGKGGGDLHH